MENIDDSIMKYLTELTELEINNLVIKSVIFSKSINECIEKGKQKIESRIDEEIKFFGKNPDNYFDFKQKILKEYDSELKKFCREYELQFINICEELQETLASQKVAIAYLRKNKKLKDSLLKSKADNIELIEDFEFSLEVYDKKIEKYIKQVENYEKITEDCNLKLEECTKNSVEDLNNLISKRINQLEIYENNNIIHRMMNKIKFIFYGKNKIQTLILDKSMLEINNLKKDVNKEREIIRENTIDFIEKILDLREKLDKNVEVFMKA